MEQPLGDKVSSNLNSKLSCALQGDWIGAAFVLGIPLLIGIYIGKNIMK